MTTLAQVPSALIARHESWVRQQAHTLMRRLPSNVEKADLIQVGLIAVAHSAVSFRWPTDPGRDPEEAFVVYAKRRVKGAMLDELRQMDQLSRAQRRKVKALQIARERWQSMRGAPPTLAELSAHCRLSIEEVVRLEALAASLADVADPSDGEDRARRGGQPCTAADEVEARVDTEIVLRRLARIWPDLPERDRRVIDAYLGIGMAPVQLAREMNVSISRMSQWHRSAVDRIADRVGTRPARAMDATDRALDQASTTTETSAPQSRGWNRLGPAAMNQRVADREAELASCADLGAWGEMVQRALALSAAATQAMPQDATTAMKAKAAADQTNRNDTVPSGP